MDKLNSTLRREELAIKLRDMYEMYGYKQYKMSKFEEYEFYLENKSFLPSQHIISFTDLSGKLLALKPDVTLSIAKNAQSQKGAPEKFYYIENVYRTPRASSEFKEIMQVGLELLGDVDLYGQCEVLNLAQKSLHSLSELSVMVVSHLDFVSGLLEDCILDKALRENILCYIGNKNTHEIARLCKVSGIGAKEAEAVAATTTLYGEFNETIEKAEKLVRNDLMQNALFQLRKLGEALTTEACGKSPLLDFSVINDMRYYKGLIFQGFVDGVPNAVLSGGRYDKLMEKLGKKEGAIGFAVYLDQLERREQGKEHYDVDALLLYDDSTDLKKLNAVVKELVCDGKRLRVQRAKSAALKYKELLKLGDGGVEVLERHD